MIALLLVACTYKESQFYNDYDAAYCGWAVSCGYFAKAADCTADVAPPVSSGCKYDDKAAKECVAGISSMKCPSNGAFPVFPTACSAVHTGCVDSGSSSGQDTASGH